MDSPARASSSPPSRIGWTAFICASLAVAAFFLLTEHRAHMLGALPYLLLLACPVLHFLMHRRRHPKQGDAGTPSTTERRSGSCH